MKRFESVPTKDNWSIWDHKHHICRHEWSGTLKEMNIKAKELNATARREQQLSWEAELGL